MEEDRTRECKDYVAAIAWAAEHNVYILPWLKRPLLDDDGHPSLDGVLLMNASEHELAWLLRCWQSARLRAYLCGWSVFMVPLVLFCSIASFMTEAGWRNDATTFAAALGVGLLMAGFWRAKVPSLIVAERMCRELKVKLEVRLLDHD